MSLMLLGRIVFGAFFLIAGLRNFAGFSDRTGMATNYGWALPVPLLIAGFGIQLVAGAALIAGLWVDIAVYALIVFLVLATALYHNLFRFSGKERAPHLYFTLVNITLAAGLLMILEGAQ
jgi:putative oxidoreductase